MAVCCSAHCPHHYSSYHRHPVHHLLLAVSVSLLSVQFSCLVAYAHFNEKLSCRLLQRNRYILTGQRYRHNAQARHYGTVPGPCALRRPALQQLIVAKDGIMHAPCMIQGFLKDQFRTAQSSNFMASAKREPITGVWGQNPRWGSGGEAPPEAECLFVFACPKEAANLPHY